MSRGKWLTTPGVWNYLAAESEMLERALERLPARVRKLVDAYIDAKNYAVTHNAWERAMEVTWAANRINPELFTYGSR